MMPKKHHVSTKLKAHRNDFFRRGKMKLTSACRGILTIWVCGVAAIEALHTADNHLNGVNIPNVLSNYNGWVNPEDLIPMPQCIAQQDQSTWLSSMTKCTHKRCTSHFGVICIHHQWLTQLSCLSTEFSPDVIKDYLPYCSRSVLGKAQLYHWIRSTTGRTWLVDVGDGNGLQNLSPASLAKGYATVNRINNAPSCLTGSFSTPSKEPFQQVMASCSFTSTTQRIGNAARPWEYSESQRSMVALGFETVGYNLTGYGIRYGDYFDRECFCSAFTTDLKHETCSGPGQIDLTRERLWFNATCGPASLPDNWTDNLKAIGFAYISVLDWHWPTCFTDMPQQVTELTDQCATDVCELDPGGYCEAKLNRAIDRACFCRNISYDSCGGSCQIFETRINYVQWLHYLCGDVQDWHGLPDNWRQLAAPSPLDMIPWRWTIKPFNNSNIDSIPRLGSARKTVQCASNEWKLGSFALVNMAAPLAAFLSGGRGIHRIARDSRWHPHPWSWFFTGILIAALQLLANYVTAFLVKKSLGYDDTPVGQLMLLWCTMPRLGWLTILPIGVQQFEAINFSTIASSLFAEVILQVFSSYYMFLTVNYGREHNFYLGRLENVERGQSAKIMYAGALLWLIVITVAFVQLMRATVRVNRLTRSGRADFPERQRSKQTTSIIVGELGAQLDEYWTWLGGKLAHGWSDRSRAPGETSPLCSERGTYMAYGTLAVESNGNRESQKVFAKLYTATIISMILLWVAQWLFWSGFIGLSSEEFCPPQLGLLTTIWIAFSVVSATFRAAY
ncbi:hypothetical protein B0J13DRAFT_555973 [Dactylonectria estremocensis]|uniref:Uncharacterized protein n=1 Tax=Dactylonectria estremocensis TaxID=1079267 RepID=A0A9P9J404_9HYPO|nr:hypothetical protein B0J13DRAFT_555973 [Dactylonectria estremocensis]